MMNVHAALPKHMRAAVPPAWKLGDEVRWRCELDVHSQRVLEPGKRAQQLVSFRLEAEINIDRRVTPAFKHCGRTPRQVHANRLTRDAPELAGQRTNALLVNRRTHARRRARS